MSDFISILNKLKESNYRQGFSDSVLSILCDELNDRKLWSKVCCGYGKEYITETYGEVVDLSKQEGAFVMPAWGTKGT
jgi:hypothetical protein